MSSKLDIDKVDDQKVEHLHSEDVQSDLRSDHADLPLIKSIVKFKRLFLTGVAASLGATYVGILSLGAWY
jgi:hypothetical protein